VTGLVVGERSGEACSTLPMFVVLVHPDWGWSMRVSEPGMSLWAGCFGYPAAFLGVWGEGGGVHRCVGAGYGRELEFGVEARAVFADVGVGAGPLCGCKKAEPQATGICISGCRLPVRAAVISARGSLGQGGHRGAGEFV